MTKPNYRIILTGKSLPGINSEDMKKNLSKILKLPLDKIERSFTGKPLLIKSGLDLSTAEKYKATFERAGAESKIIPLSPGTGKSLVDKEKEPDMPAREEHQQPPRVTEQSDVQETERRIISPDPKPVSLQYTSLPCRSITATKEGLNFNRYNCDNILFTDIIFLSVFNVQKGAKFKTKLLVFLKRQKKPLLSDAHSIQYDDFTGTRDEDDYISLRNFVNLAIKNNPKIIIDESTNRFLQGGKPEIIKKDVDFHSSAIGATLDSENLFELSVMKGTITREQSGSTQSSMPDGHKIQSKPAKSEPPVYSEEEYLSLFIGQNSEKYLKKFKVFEKSKGFCASWHWPAFLFPFFWLLYRKFYLLALGIFFLSFIPLVNILVYIAMGISANYLYYSKAQKTLNEFKTHADRYDITANLIKEGGVSTTSVFLGFASIFLIAIIIGGGIIIQTMIKNQQAAVNEMLETQEKTPFVPTLPDMPPGLQKMPRNPEEFMNAAYEMKTKAVLKNTCSMAQMFFSENPDEMVSLAKLEEYYGFTYPQDIDIRIIDPSMEGLLISAQHDQSSEVFYIDDKCNYQ